MAKRAASDYESDDGFVDDAPKGKKTKGSASTTKGTAKATLASDGTDPFWELGTDKKKASVSDYKGTILIGIREYYEDKQSGESRPGKKGISLTVDQYRALLAAIPEINGALRARGQDVGEPEVEDDGDAAMDENGERKHRRTTGKAGKSNIEETSDEEE